MEKLNSPEQESHKTGIGKKALGFIDSFKKFAIQGNILDLAIGVVIGTAFKDLIDSLVKDIIMPPIGYLTAKVDFAELYFNLDPRSKAETLDQAQAAGDPVILYGNFINVSINFIIIALVIFVAVRAIARFVTKEKAKEEAKPKRRCPYCYSEVNRKATKCPSCTSTLSKPNTK